MSGTRTTVGGGRHRRRSEVDWRGRLAGVLLGVVAGGMAVNLMADGFGGRGLVAAVLAGAVFAAAAWLRALPPRAPLARHALRMLLLGALVAAVAGTFAWRPWPTVLALGLTATAILTTAEDLAAAAVLLRGAAVVGVGVAVTAYSVGVIRVEGFTAQSCAGVLLGAAAVVLGVSLTGGDALYGVALAVFGSAVVVVGGASAAVGHHVHGAAVVGAGLALLLLAMSHSICDDRLGSAGFAGLAVTSAVLAADALGVPGGAIYATLWGFAALGFAGFAVARRTGSRIVASAGYLCLAPGLLAFGVWALLIGDLLPGVAMVAVGAALVGVGGAGLLEGRDMDRLRGWWEVLTSDPADRAASDVGGPSTGATAGGPAAATVRVPPGRPLTTADGVPAAAQK